MMEPNVSLTKIYPSAEELSTINTNIPCTEVGCSCVFATKSNLALHLAKTHKIEHLFACADSVREFYCPDISCIYNNDRHFKKLKHLKQHYLKVHSEKTFMCDKCGKGFSTEASKNTHQEYCGATFSCSECLASYSAYESLLTHGRRKKHKVLEKSHYKCNSVCAPVCTTSAGDLNVLPVGSNDDKERFILPKGSVSLQLLCYKLSFDKGSQTDLKGGGRVKKEKISCQETQTQKNAKPQMTAETQTIGDYVSVAPKKIPSTTSLDEKKSIKTQTVQVDSSSKSCNTSFNLPEFDFETSSYQVERNSSSTQTSIHTDPVINHNNNNTDFEFIDTSSQTNFSGDMDFDYSETFLNTETQTDLIFENELLNPDFYTHMHTQTCDDILLNDLTFNDIHTQTVLQEMLKSVESQTTMMLSSSSHDCLGAVGRNMLPCRDMAHMETQTEVEFKQMLEEINA